MTQAKQTLKLIGQGIAGLLLIAVMVVAWQVIGPVAGQPGLYCEAHYLDPDPPNCLITKVVGM